MRYQWLDILRGIAVVLMILFHLNYTLVNIFEVYVLDFSEIFWYVLGKIAAILFICISGISFFLAEQKYKRDIMKKYVWVSSILWCIALGISIGTYFLIPEEYIRFGIIHFFAFSFLLLLVFRYLRYWNICIWTLIIIYGVYFIPVVNIEYLYLLWYRYPGFSSADFYPLFPYFWVILLWYSSWLLLEKYNLFGILHIKRELTSLEWWLEYIWKRSLLLYLIHQLIIIVMIYTLMQIW